MKKFILVLNLGSTTTKVALFRDLNCHIVKTYSHDKELISQSINEQKAVRYHTLMMFFLNAVFGRKKSALSLHAAVCFILWKAARI